MSHNNFYNFAKDSLRPTIRKQIRTGQAGTVFLQTSISRIHGSETHTVTGTETAAGAEALAATDVAGETSRNAVGRA